MLGRRAPSCYVQLYTRYYHAWQANAKQHERHACSLPEGSPARAEALRHAEWAKFYADQSSRASHHFYNRPATPAPFDLPPAPPVAVQPKEEKSGLGEYEVPDSLTRYVRSCLKQCKTDDQRKAVQNEAEKLIAQAIESGSLQSRDWDSAVLIEPPTAALPQQPIADASPHKPSRISEYRADSTRVVVGGVSDNTSYYGPSATANESRDFDDALSSSASSSDFSYQNKKRNLEHNNISKDRTKRHKSSPDTESYNTDSTTVSLRSNLGGMTISTSTLEKRATRFSASVPAVPAAAEATEDFGRYMGKGLIGGSGKKLDDSDYEKMTVKGTCERLEKEYLRLTAPPRAELVRPLRVLQKHLGHLKMEWKQKNRRDYLWFCSQLKAVRQDCTVQRIHNAFAVDVYETHARIALEEGDMNEYNQCQTQLKYLYERLREDPAAVRNKNEFAAYLIIYTVCLTINQKYDGGSSDLLKIILSLTPEERRDSSISHALKVQTAVANADYHNFFCMRNKCPNSGKYLLEMIVPYMRSMAVRRICKAYRPSVDVSFVLGELGFGREERDAGVDWLSSQGCAMSPEGGKLLTKACQIREDGKYSLI